MTTSVNDFDLVVIGACIVGMSTALWAQKEGLMTLICDPNSPGSGTAFGSACTIATYEFRSQCRTFPFYRAEATG